MRIVEGPGRGQVVRLTEEWIVGRAESGAGALRGDEHLSRRHARFLPDADGVVVEDLGSSNGTYVNGARISAPRRLVPGDVVRIGATTLRYEVPAATRLGPPPPAGAPAAAPPAAAVPVPPLGARRSAAGRFAAVALVLLAVVGGVAAYLLTRDDGGGPATAGAATPPGAATTTGGAGTDEPVCVPADNGRSGPGHFRFITSACENPSRTIAVFPLQRGVSHGQPVYYVVTDSSDRADALARGVNFAPKLANAARSAGVQKVTEQDGALVFPATVQFGRTRVLRAGAAGFPPAEAQPPAVGEAGYSPLIVLPSGVVLNAPHVANGSGPADKVVDLDTQGMRVRYRETEGRYEDKAVHYGSFDASDPVAAAIEDVTYAPALAQVPKAGDEGLKTSAREQLDAFVDGPTGVDNPGRQGVNAAILDGRDPHNILHEAPVLPAHPDVGSTEYAPMWDVHLASWTAEAIAAGSRVPLAATPEVLARVTEKTITAPGGAPFGPSGIVINCPLISVDIP